jgi:hypothetical protein
MRRELLLGWVSLLVVGLFQLGLLELGVVRAQYAYRPYGAVAPYGAAYGYGGGWAAGSTAAGSYAAGMGQLIQAQGAYNQMTAQAMIPYEQAKSMALDNKLKSAQTYYELQRMNREQQAAQKEREKKIWTTKVPPPKIPRLSPSQLDPVTGQIFWPPVFMQPMFDLPRKQLDDLFVAKVKDPTLDLYGQARGLAFSMRDQYDTLRNTMTTSEFFANRHFLESLAEEPRYIGYQDATASAPAAAAPAAATP